MDKFWSIFCFPIGLLICFGPVIVAWLWQEFGTPTPQKPEEPK